MEPWQVGKWTKTCGVSFLTHMYIYRHDIARYNFIDGPNLDKLQKCTAGAARTKGPERSRLRRGFCVDLGDVFSRQRKGGLTLGASWSILEVSLFMDSGLLVEPSPSVFGGLSAFEAKIWSEERPLGARGGDSCQGSAIHNVTLPRQSKGKPLDCFVAGGGGQ